MKKLHQYLGLLMFLPFLAWAITGVFFFIKPGYNEAYESLNIKTYVLTKLPQINIDKNWSEIRMFSSVLGDHLLVKSDKGWQQIDSQTLQIKKLPSEKEITQLVNEAIQLNPKRYGQIKSIDELKIITNTGITISLNWSQMSFHQTGNDTQFINNMYKIHYLQWTGIKAIDKILGIVGLGLVIILAFLGLSMIMKRNRSLKER